VDLRIAVLVPLVGTATAAETESSRPELISRFNPVFLRLTERRAYSRPLR
jgi:hypothetical protein